MSALKIDALKSLFGVVEHCPSLVLWIRSLDFRRQLFVSPSYTGIWGQRVEELYESPVSWIDFLYRSDYDNVISFCNKRMQVSDDKQQDKVLYRIRSNDNEIKFIKDIHFQIEDNNQEVIAFAGLIQNLNERQWHAELQSNHSLEHDGLLQFNLFITHVLRNELKVKMTPKSSASEPMSVPVTEYQGFEKGSDRPLIFSRQEIACLVQLMEGKSAKLTAAELNLSSRTVEYHLNKIRQKLSCRSKLEIFKKIELKKVLKVSD